MPVLASTEVSTTAKPASTATVPMMARIIVVPSHFWPANPHLPDPSPAAVLASESGGVRVAFVCFVSAVELADEARQAAPRRRPVLQQARRAARLLAADRGA